MTNTRHKTFATPLEFWQWAIEDSMRQAQNSIGHRFMVQVSPSTGAVIPWRAIGLQGGPLGPTDSDCPLTAVEDEHGVIEEPVKNDPLVRAFKLAFSPALSDHDRERMAAAIRDEASRIADERIAAATVEWHGPHGNWAVDHNCRLKPKGDA